jgi:nitrous oxidase accessory protein
MGLALLVSAGGGQPPARAAGEVIVSGHGAFSSISEALAVAENGDTVTVSGGVHTGPLHIERSITLQGLDWPVVDGGGSGTVISVQAPGVTVRGLVVRNSGLLLVNEDAAIEVEAPGAVIDGNRIEDSLFGIYLRDAPRSQITRNTVTGKDIALARRGDGIRVWYSSDTLIEGNTVLRSRDVVLWYSERLTLRGNAVTDGRYGLHFMYDDDAVVEGNRLMRNSVGAFLMYSRRLAMRNNVIGHNRGPSGYGIGMKDLDDAVVRDNLFAGNRVGAYVDNSPREIDSRIEFTGNVFTLNDYGVRLMPSVKRNEFSGNSFVDNQEQVEAAGGGSLAANNWSVGGRGNYWSDYAGYDADGDSIGDISYRPVRLFEKLVDTHPELRLLTYSPAEQAVDFAAQLLPLIRPEPKLTDDAPLMSPGSLPGLTLDPETSPAPIALTSLGLIGGGVSLLALSIFTARSRMINRHARAHTPSETSEAAIPVITVRNLTKRFGSGRAIDGLSFDVTAGEGVVLWGPNGAGKTTLIRCLLGLYRFDGEVEVCGHSIRRHGKEARHHIGLVPQEISFHDDLTVRRTIHLYARLRRANPAECGRLLDQLDLTPHAGKQVRQLSGGLKQRLALAVALLGDPAVLLLDEPTANLDFAARREFIGLLEKLKSEGKTLVFASHRPWEALRLADRVISLKDGKLVVDGPVANLPELRLTGARMRIVVGPENIEGALDQLARHGFAATSNGAGVYVDVRSGRKVEPVAALLRSGTPVIDFDLSDGGMEDGDD